MCDDLELDLECEPRSVPRARRQVVEWFESLTAECRSLVGRRDDLLLITSELVSNAIRVCQDSIQLRVNGHATFVQVAVTDDDPEPATPRVADEASIGGRGLAIVAALSEAWGQTSFDGTKTVWSRLRLPDRPTSDRGPSVA